MFLLMNFIKNFNVLEAVGVKDFNIINNLNNISGCNMARRDIYSKGRANFEPIPKRQTSSPSMVNIWGRRAHYEFSKDVLLALAKATNRTLGAHVPRHAILSKYASKNRRDARRALKEIIRMGFATKHPTRNQMTFHLTRSGLTLVRKLEQNEET